MTFVGETGGDAGAPPLPPAIPPRGHPKLLPNPATAAGRRRRTGHPRLQQRRPPRRAQAGAKAPAAPLPPSLPRRTPPREDPAVGSLPGHRRVLGEVLLRPRRRGRGSESLQQRTGIVCVTNLNFIYSMFVWLEVL